MKLGTKTFTALGTVDSDPFVPDRGLRFTLVGVPSHAGTCEVWMYDTEEGSSAAVEADPAGSPVTGAADQPNVFPVEGAYGGAGIAFFLRYVNTSNNSGSVRFRVGLE